LLKSLVPAILPSASVRIPGPLAHPLIVTSMGACGSKGNSFANPLPGVEVNPEFTFLEELRLAITVEQGSELKGAEALGSLAEWCALNILDKERDEEHYAKLAGRVAEGLGHGVDKNDFQTVPTSITKATLAQLFKGNPFLASAIQVETLPDVGPRLCVKSHTTPEDRTSPNFFNKLTACMEDRWDRFHIVLNERLEIESGTFYRCCEGKWESVELDEQDQIKVITSTLMFYFQCVHANLHIFHFMLVCGLYTLTRKNSKLEVFAAPYLPNIVLKYEEVVNLLISKTGALTSGFCKGNRFELLGVLTELLSCWGNCSGSKQFVEQFLFPPAFEAEPLASLDFWVPQFRAQSDLVPAFAKDVADHMRADADYALTELDASMKRFFSKCGPGVFAITSLQQWLELMSVTGLFHGCTLSLTRVTFTEANLWQMAPSSDKFTAHIVEQLTTAFGTLVGLDADREVFTDTGLDSDLGLQKIVHSHLERSQTLKQDYADSLDKSSEEFKQWGWILTDYFPGLFDAKQLTITTYI